MAQKGAALNDSARSKIFTKIYYEKEILSKSHIGGIIRLWS
jgi:hypothetical protein